MRASVRRLEPTGGRPFFSSFLLIEFNYAIGAAKTVGLLISNMAARFSFIFDTGRPSPTVFEQFLCKNEVLLVLWTKQATVGLLFRLSLPDSHSF
jgi:hypothetical protein